MARVDSRDTSGPPSALRIVAAVAGVCVAVAGFEFALGYAGILLFSHIDTPDCASTDPFCVPGEASGLTPRAALLLLMNGAAVLALSLFLALRAVRPTAAERDTPGAPSD